MKSQEKCLIWYTLFQGFNNTKLLLLTHFIYWKNGLLRNSHYIKCHQISISLYQCLNRKNVEEAMIKTKCLSSEISKRFNHFEYLDNHNDTFIKCKSKNNQTLEKVCGDTELYHEKRNDAISCKRNHSNVVVQLTKGDICRDVQFLETMNYTTYSISFVKDLIYSGKIFNMKLNTSFD